MNLLNKYKWIILGALFAFFLGYISKPASNMVIHQQTEEPVKSWICSMHPQIRQPEPGKCPICAMDLIPIMQNDDTGLAERELKLSPSAIKLAEVQTSLLKFGKANDRLTAYGKIGIDETRLKIASARVPGRIDKMYVDFTGDRVRAGEPLVEIYSPELYVAQQEYLEALFAKGSFPIAVTDVEKKFELWGFSKKQLDELKQSGQAGETMTVLAPIDGVVLEKNVAVGDYVKTGSELYEIADLSYVWIFLQVFEKDIAEVKIGQKLLFSVKSLPAKNFSARVDFIDPIVDEMSRTIKIRAVAKNVDDSLKPGLLVSAEFNLNSDKNELLVPASAVLLTGERAVVYVALRDGIFAGREIVVGNRVGNDYIVKSGLSGNERVVTNGAFKIDSEMQIKAKKSMMNPAGTSSMLHSHEGHDYVSETPDTHQRQAVHSMITQSQSTMLDMQVSLDPVYSSYFKVQDQLSHDKTDIKKHIAELLDAIADVHVPKSAENQWSMLSKRATQAAQTMSATENMTILRAEFKKLSDALIVMAADFGHSEQIVVNQFHCPMAFNNAGADWLSSKNVVENPYYGSAMFSCGSQVEQIGLPESGGE